VDFNLRSLGEGGLKQRKSITIFLIS